MFKSFLLSKIFVVRIFFRSTMNTVLKTIVGQQKIKADLSLALSIFSFFSPYYVNSGNQRNSGKDKFKFSKTICWTKIVVASIVACCIMFLAFCVLGIGVVLIICQYLLTSQLYNCFSKKLTGQVTWGKLESHPGVKIVQILRFYLFGPP